MGSRATLNDGVPKLLGNHGGWEGRAFRRAYESLLAEYGPFPSQFLRFEAARVAVCSLQFVRATRELTTAQRKRRSGKGRRPNPQQVERLARRQGLADGSYGSALSRFQELVTRNGRKNDLATNIQAALQGQDG